MSDVPSKPPSQALPMPPYPWQQPLWNKFVTWIGQDRLAHALLLAGPQGLGGSALAAAMAQYLLCQAPTGALACGKCRACQLLASDSHPDLFRVFPETPGGAIKIAQIRELTEFINKTAQQGGRKVVVLDPAEAMNQNAANALLKSLEEPTERTYLVLVSPKPSQLLATIRSRCAMLQLTPPPAQDAIAWLNKAGINDAEVLLNRAGGEPLKVQSWFERDFPAQQEKMRQDLEALALGRRSPLVIAKAWLEQDPLETVDSLQIWIQQAVRAALAPAAVAADVMPEGLQAVPVPLLYRYLDKVVQTKKDLQSQNNANLELLLDELLMGWVSLVNSSRARSAG